jgi:hypothetical protein
MGVALFAVCLSCLAVLATASEASQSCMNKGEARRHFGSVHIYWHGAGHCWNATSTRHDRADRVREKTRHQVERKTSHPVQSKVEDPAWKESMSQMLPGDEESTPASWIDRWVNIEPAQSPVGARWVDIVQAAPANMADSDAGAVVTPRSVVMGILIILLTLAIFEFLLIGIRLAGSLRPRH